MSGKSPSTSSNSWTVGIAVLLISIGLGIAAFAYQSTTQIREALAQEVLQQQHDVSALIQEYGNVMLALERKRFSSTPESRTAFSGAMQSAQKQLEVMRSNYTFARLDGAAKAHAYAKPILEDIDQWSTNGIYGFSGENKFVLDLAAERLEERYPVIQEITLETKVVANELITEQTDYLERFRNSLLLLLTGFAITSLTIATWLIRQRNLQARVAADKEEIADAETRGRHQAEEALLGSEQFLRATLNSLHSDIAILDNDGIITAVNTPWRKFVSSNNKQYQNGGVNHHFETVLKATATTDLESEGVSTASWQISEVLDNKRQTMFFEYPRNRDANRQWSLLSVSTFNTEDGRHAVLAHEDVSERKGLEERDRRLRAELAHVSRLTTAGELASGLAHELNQPLTAITHNCDAVMSSINGESSMNTELIETVHDISEQAQRAGGIIRSMRQLVRKDTTDLTPTDLNKLVRETVRLTAPEAREKGIIVKLRLQEDLPKPLCDPVQIQQVLVNLERNSVEAMWQGNSTVRELSIETSLSSPKWVEVGVSDTGPGIEPAFFSNLYTAFQTTKTGGMGLGLSISRTIVEKHGGRLWVEPNTEGVTTFKFNIPT